jgi:hypothetical protein
VRFPVAVGVQVTWMEQRAPALSALPQGLVRAKSPLPAMLVMLSVAWPMLPKVTTGGELAIPMGGLVNPRLVGERVTAGAGKGVISWSVKMAHLVAASPTRSAMHWQGATRHRSGATYHQPDPASVKLATGQRPIFLCPTPRTWRVLCPLTGADLRVSPTSPLPSRYLCCNILQQRRMG